MTVTQTKWVTQWVDSCYNIYNWEWPWFEAIKNASYSFAMWDPNNASANYFEVDAQQVGSGVSFGFNTVPGSAQHISLDVHSVVSGIAEVEAGHLINGNWVSLGRTNITKGGVWDMLIEPIDNTVLIRILGPCRIRIKRVCIKKPVQVQQSYLVDVCSDMKDRYRFGFNGQEKVNEWSGIGNHNTAEFWEYDTRTGRRGNLDPKPHPSWSFYSTFSGNPIWFSDPSGDTAVITYNTGQGGREIRHVNGSWIDSKTRAGVSVEDVKDENVKELMKEYDELNKNKDLDPLTSTINNSTANVRLLYRKGLANITYTEGYLKGTTDDIFIELGGGGKWEKGYQENYKKIKGTLATAIAHELGHAYDAILEKQKPNPSLDAFTNVSEVNNFDGRTVVYIAESEVNAMFWENVVRVHNNLPLRITYAIDKGDRAFTGAGITPIIERTNDEQGNNIGVTIKDLHGNSLFRPNSKKP